MGIKGTAHPSASQPLSLCSVILFTGSLYHSHSSSFFPTLFHFFQPIIVLCDSPYCPPFFFFLAVCKWCMLKVCCCCSVCFIVSFLICECLFRCRPQSELADLMFSDYSVKIFKKNLRYLCYWCYNTAELFLLSNLCKQRRNTSDRGL